PHRSGVSGLVRALVPTLEWRQCKLKFRHGIARVDPGAIFIPVDASRRRGAWLVVLFTQAQRVGHSAPGRAQFGRGGALGFWSFGANVRDRVDEVGRDAVNINSGKAA